MKEVEYSKSLEKAIEKWRKENPVFLQDMVRGISGLRSVIQKDYIPMLNGLGESISALKTMQEQLSKNFPILTFESSLLKSIREANLFMSTTLESYKPFYNIAIQIGKDQRKWVGSLASSIGAIPQAAEIAFALRKNISTVINSALLTQQTIARFDLKSIGESFNLGLNSQLTLCKSITEMVNTYRNFWNTLNIDPQKFFSMPLAATQIPNTEMNITIYQAEISRKSPMIFPEQEEFIVAIEPSELSVIESISLIDATLVKLYKGAIESYKSNNPDRIRHCTTSLRELFTHVLHKLAPDKDFFEWSEHKLYLDDKRRPTREGRLLFICRNINYSPLSKFIDKDISTSLIFLNLFQEGTHAIKPSFSEKQLKAMFIKMKCLIMYLIEISRHL
jgi:hypothetical protein